MQNLHNFNFNKLGLRLSMSEYYDFTLAKDEDYNLDHSCVISGSCVVAHFDFNESDTLASGQTVQIYSLATWEDAVSTGVTATTYGLTALDNGAQTVNLDPSDLTNQILVDALTGTTLHISSGNTTMFLTQVSGHTGQVSYPLEYIASGSPVGSYVDFKGGFYQGYYKLHGYGYQVLPDRVNKGLMFDFLLKKDDSVVAEEDILNDLYPDNKGIFFYWGSRAENKFWNQFEGNNTGSTSGCTVGATELCTIPKEGDIEILNEAGNLLPLNPPLITYTTYDNQFLLYGRARGEGLGTLTACEVTGETPTITVSGYNETTTNTTNGFLLYGRSKGKTCGGGRPSDGYGREVAGTFSGTAAPILTLDKDADIIDNALAFRITDDGRIGYRLLTVTGACVEEVTVTGTTIQEGYSEPNMVTEGDWHHISVRWVADYYLDDCELQSAAKRNGKLMFYVDCRLKYVAHDFPEFVASSLDDYKEKQVGVPYNISLGGGSQGLMESMTFDGQDPEDLNLAIQENFAGTFIGSISQFKIYNTDVNWCALKGLCNTNRYQ